MIAQNDSYVKHYICKRDIYEKLSKEPGSFYLIYKIDEVTKEKVFEALYLGDQLLNIAPTIEINDSNYWVINGIDTEVKATGAQGPQGVQGPIGPQGVRGESGQSFHVEGTLDSTDLLPTPTQVIRAGAYLIPSNFDPNEYDMWIIVGGHNEGDELEWMNAGQVTGIQGPQGPEGPQGIQGPEGPQGPAGTSTIYYSIPSYQALQDQYIGYGWVIPKINNATYTCYYSNSSDYSIESFVMQVASHWDTPPIEFQQYQAYQLVSQESSYVLFPADPSSGRYTTREQASNNWLSGGYIKIEPNA